VPEIKSQGSKAIIAAATTRGPQTQGFFQAEGLTGMRRGDPGLGAASGGRGFIRDQWHSWQNSCRPLTRAPQWGQKARSYSGILKLAPQDRQKRAFPSTGSWQ